MKYLLIIFLFVACNPKTDKAEIEKIAKQKTADTEQLSVEEVSRMAKGKPRPPVAVASPIQITHVSGNTFTVDYGGVTDVVWMYFRWGSELWPSGNVNPYSSGSGSQSFYKNPVTTITANGSSTYYQLIVHSGSTERDANGVLLANWVTYYSNVVQ